MYSDFRMGGGLITPSTTVGDRNARYDGDLTVCGPTHVQQTASNASMSSDRLAAVLV